MKTRRMLLCAAAALSALLITPALAAEQEITDVYCFSQTDFGETVPEGVMFTAVPDASMGTIFLGSREIRAGDVITGEQLSSLTFVPTGKTEGDAVISCLNITGDGQTEASEMTLKVGKNDPPVAEDSEFQTYKNVPGLVRLSVSDPDGDPLTVTIVTQPKRGTVTVAADEAVTYTPNKNKVGKDSFSYTVTDSAGNVSEEATVRVVIEKPSDKQTYADMDGNSALLAATWLREEGIYSGETVSGVMLFQPDETVTRGEFIAMCAGLTGQSDDAETLKTGFADESDTPAWLGSYVSEAVKCGYLRGIPSDGGLLLDANSDITEAQAVKMVSSLLSLGEDGTESVMAGNDSVPAWAVGAASAMADSGVYTVTDAGAPLTRAEAAQLLYDAWQESQQNENSLLSWAQEQ